MPRCRDGPSEARLFSRLVADAAGSGCLSVIASLRSDYYGRLQEDSDLFPACERIDVPPLSVEQVEEVIRKPVAALGARFETPEIVPMIAEATAREPGSLPLLSYMMAEAWDAMRADDASDGVLRFPLGVVDVARPLVDRAELFLKTRPESEDALRRLFTLRLAHVPKEGEAVRRRARRSECRPDEWALAEELAGSGWRLLSTGDGEDGEPTAEVAHEALLRKWPRLTAWLDEARGFLIWKGQLEGARLEWEAAPEDKKPGALLMGLPLETAATWKAARGADLPPGDLGFIDASLAAEERRRAEELRKAEELEAERIRSEKRRKMITRVSLIAAVVSFCLIIAAGWQWREAERTATELSASNAKLLTAIEDAKTHQVEIMRAKRAVDRALQTSDMTRQQAEAELFRSNVERARFRSAKATELLQAGLPDAALAVAVAAFPENEEERWTKIDGLSGASFPLTVAASESRASRLLHKPGSGVVRVGFSKDGAPVIFTGLSGGMVRIWDAIEDRMTELDGHEGDLRDATPSPDGSTVLTASVDGTARLWNARNGEQEVVLLGHLDAVVSAVFSTDGTRILTASSDGTAQTLGQGERHGIDAVARTQGRRVESGFLDGRRARAHDIRRWHGTALECRHRSRIRSFGRLR